MIDLEKYKDYIQSETPNRKLVADIIQEIKDNRSAATYAEDIGLNPTRISRIVNGNYANALDMDTLSKLADGDEKYFERLLNANGILSPKEQERKNRKKEMQNIIAAYKDRERKCSSIIVSELLSRGVSIRQGDGRLEYKCNQGFCKRFDYEFEVTDKNGECINWYFEICSHVTKEIPLGRINSPYFRFKMFFENKMHIFLVDAWKPEILKNCKISFVFCDDWMMTEFEKQIVKEKLNNRFSLILVDLEELKVLKEVLLKEDDDIYVFKEGVIDNQESDYFFEKLEGE